MSKTVHLKQGTCICTTTADHAKKMSKEGWEPATDEEVAAKYKATEPARARMTAEIKKKTAAAGKKAGPDGKGSQ